MGTGDRGDGAGGIGYVPTLPAPPDPEAEAEDDGTLVAGKYRLLREIGRGRSTVTYEALQNALGRRAAVKLLEPGADPAEERRMLAEAKLCAQLAHPNVLEVYELGQHGGSPFVAMELLTGETLRARIDREGALGVARAARVGVELVQALRIAHAHGVVHRGLTPHSVFLVMKRDAEVVKLADFGVRADADPRLDLYAAGVVLYEALSGRLPFAVPREDEAPDLNAAYTRLPPGPSEARPELGLDADAFVTRALAAGRAERFQTADEMLDAWCSIAAFADYIHA